MQILKCSSDGALYCIDNGFKRKIPSMRTFHSQGFFKYEIKTLSSDDAFNDYLP